jgi:hypothetical protein
MEDFMRMNRGSGERRYVHVAVATMLLSWGAVAQEPTHAMQTVGPSDFLPAQAQAIIDAARDKAMAVKRSYSATITDPEIGTVGDESTMYELDAGGEGYHCYLTIQGIGENVRTAVLQCILPWSEKGEQGIVAVDFSGALVGVVFGKEAQGMAVLQKLVGDGMAELRETRRPVTKVLVSEGIDASIRMDASLWELNVSASLPKKSSAAVIGDATFRVGGLEWQRTPTHDQQRFRAAKTYCSRLHLSGKGWRLPTQGELSELYVASQRDKDLAQLPSMGSGWWWSSTLNNRRYSVEALLVSFLNGGVGADFDAGSAWRVRCVRTAKNVRKKPSSTTHPK